MKKLSMLSLYSRIVGVNVFTIVLIVSLIASSISTIMYSCINSLNEILSSIVLGPHRGDTIVFIASSTTPFTGIMDSRRFLKLSGINGVYTVSLELLVPVLANGKPIVMRGVDANFTKLVNISIVDGIEFDPDCLYCIWVGVKAAGYLRVSVGDRVEVRSFFSNGPSYLVVAGVYRTGRVYDEEILAPITLARAIRGSDKYSASIARIAYNPGVITRNELLSILGANYTGEIGEEGGRHVLPVYVVEKIFSAQARTGIAVVREESIADMYLRRIGLSSDVFSAVSVAVLVVVSYSLFVLGELVTTLRHRQVYSLYTQGISIVFSKIIISLLSTPLIIAGTIFGLLVGRTIISCTGIPILFGYMLKPVDNLLYIAVLFSSNVLLFITGIMAVRVGEKL